MLIPIEREPLVFPWNRSATDYPRDSSVAQLFQDQARAAPASIALEYGGERLSYGELNRRANRLAHHLRARGVALEDRVGLMLEPGVELVVALLGILKAGGAYLPLDLDYPAARLEFMLEDSHAALLLTSSGLQSRAAGFGGEKLLLDRDRAEIESAPDHDPEIDCGAENLAYVIYTSGSTGIPKGVEILQRAIVRLVKNTNYYQVGADDRILQASNLSFDAATFEIWGALLNGARLVGIDRQQLLDPLALAGVLRERAISAMFVTTAVFNQVARQHPECFAGLEALLFGGEVADCDAVRRVLAQRPPRRLLHVYGPTESTTFASWYPVTALDPDAVSLPIGYPVANTTLYVLDDKLQPLPPGVAGELYIGGDGLARGYLNRPGLSAERFIASPFEAAARLYRSGDRVRYGEDGAIEFIGRFDDQVKLRGFRIELGEVETALRSLADIEDAVVVLHETASGDRQLAAYFVARGAAETARRIAGIRAQLERRLPPYMLPACYLELDALPLTPNGKIDRAALPHPAAAARGAAAPPRNRLQRKLAEIWAQVLGLPQVGIDEPFLELGGHSLLASRVVTRIREELGIDLKLSDFYRGVDVAELARQVESLGPAAATEAPERIEAAPRDGPLPVSFAQEQVIFLHQLAPGNLAYNTQMSIRLHGRLDPAALERALGEILRRHEIFRSSYELVDGVAQQRLHPRAVLEFGLEDLSAFDGAERESRERRILAAEIGRSFDISRLPLVRWKLIRLAADEHRLLHVEHHLVHDGWSFGVFLRELQALYGAYAEGRESPLPELPIQFADFVVWQRRRLQGERLQRLLDYWQARLAPPLPVLQLPTDFPRPPQQSHRGAELVVDLPPSLADQLRELSRRENTTLYITALSIFFILLHKYSGQQDIVIGTGVANRPLREVEGLIGMFVNALPLRADLSGDPRCDDLIARIRAMAFEAYEHQELPFEKLVETLPVERDLACNPLFQVLFSFHDSQVPVLECPGLRGRVEYLHNGSAKFDINLVVIPWAEQLVGLGDEARDRRITMKWEYATDLFGADTVAAMARHYQNLVRELARDSGRPLSQLSMLAADERRQLLEGAQRAKSFPVRQGLAGLFAAAAAQNPQATAVEFEAAKLTYGELNRRANQLAHHLRAAGVEREVLVGLMLPRGLEMIVGLLAVLKAGGAYLPLDPDYPRARVEFMLRDAGAPLLLTLAGQQPPAGFGGRVICLDRDWPEIAARPETDPPAEAGVDDAAYVIYTSGSTGEPKGVVVTQRNVVRLFAATGHCCGFGNSDVWTLFHSIAFDFSVWEIWGALLHGGRLVVVSREVSRSPERFHDLLRDSGVTVLNQTPSAFRQLMLADLDRPRAALGQLRLVIFGGEALDPQSLRPWFEKYGELQPRLINMYGITETTVHASYRPLRLADAGSGASPIGRALADLQIYILDAHRQPVPAGVAGEIYVGGAGVARGYLNRPQLTAERFIDNPFGERPGERLYRSGDLARYRADGDIEYLGRGDQQVKIRGFRIELGEIETRLRQHPGVRAAAAVARARKAGDQRLLAYVVADAADAPAASALRNHLRADLPDYMLPAAFVFVDALPLTANGKLDRDALPEPEAERDAGSGYLAPATLLERRLVQIWEEVLNLRPIGVGDNFFELGGHSLLATQVVSRIRKQLEIEIPLSAMFSSPTVAQLRQVVESLPAGTADETARPVVSRARALPLSYAQQRLWFLDQLQPANPAYNLPAAIRLRGALDVDALRSSLQQIIDRHEVLRTAFVLRGGQPRQRVRPRLELELPLEEIGGPASARPAALLRRLREDALAPFDLAAGEVVRWRLLRLAQDEHVLLLTMHHIVADAWSAGVLFRELSALYSACRGHRPNPLPRLTMQYADYAIRQREWLDGAVLQTQLDYWKSQLAGLAPLRLPTDHPRPAVQTFHGAQATMLLQRRLSARLEALARQQGATLFMTLLAAFALLLQRYCGQDDVVVGTPIANRNRRETEDLIGFFLNTLVMRTDLSGNPRFTDLLARVRQTALAAYEHQDLPFERLVDELQPERDRSRSPLFQVLFAVQNAPSAALELEGLTLERMEFDPGTTRFDLELHVWQQAPRLRMKIAYNTDLFERGSIERLFRHYRNLLGQIAADPGRRISELALLTRGEYRQLVEVCNRSRVDFSDRRAVHELFAAQAARTPHAVALEFEGRRLAYGELDARANRLAQGLRARGVGADIAVGVCLPRGAEAVTAALAVMKAGGAYAPLDPSYPAARLQFMLRQAGAAALITSSALAGELAAVDARPLLVDAPATRGADDSRDPRVAVRPQHAAYVIFTSGSTGRPKGVVVPHAALGNLVRWQLRRSGEVGQGRTLQLSAPGFDVSLQEIFSTLCAGGTLVTVSDAVRRDPAELLDFIDGERVNRVFVPFAGLNQLAEAARERVRVPQSLREIVTAGEALQVTPAIENLFARLDGCSLDNQYGPTESHVVSAHRLEGDARGWPRLPPIGRPIANARIYLLDEALRPVPAGVPGEIHIAGVCLAKGYAGREDLTREKFVRDPFSEDPGARMYRSGDLARLGADGRIEYLGRIDAQVKLRGYRIEPGEIEAVMTELPGIESCAVTLREDRPGDRRLVAYYVGAGLEHSDIRHHLESRLPEFMLPAALVELERLPLTPSGKIDRRALPAPAGERPADAALVAPRTATEGLLVDIWQQVLGLEPIGVEDNFFELGGHSMMAMQLISRINRSLNLGLRVAELFSHPDVARLARRIEVIRLVEGVKSEADQSGDREELTL